MKLLLPTDKIELKRLEKAIGRNSKSAILLVGVDSKELSEEFSSYLIKEHQLKLFSVEDKILSEIVDSKEEHQNNFYIVNIFNNSNAQHRIDHLQFQRDYINLKEVRLVVILSNEMLEYLKINAGDLFSTTKFSYSFTSHQYEVTFEENDKSLDNAIQKYEAYLEKNTKDNQLLCELTYDIGSKAYEQGDNQRALKYLEDSLLYASGNIHNKVLILSNLGVIYNELSKYKEARSILKKALRLNKSLNDLDMKADILINLGVVYYYLHNFKKAHKYYDEALIIKKSVSDLDGIASILIKKGLVELDESNYENALKYQNDALVIHQELNNIKGISACLSNISSVYQRQGKYTEALDTQHKSLKLLQQINNKSWIADALLNLGNLYSALDNDVLALEYYEQSLLLNQELSNKYAIAIVLNSIGTIYNNQSNFNKAIKYLQESLNISKNKELENTLDYSDVLGNLAISYSKLENYEEALDYFSKAYKIKKKLGDLRGLSATLHNIGTIYLAQGKYDEARAVYEESLKNYKTIGAMNNIANGLHSLGNLYNTLGDKERALEFQREALEIAKEHNYLLLKSNIYKSIALIYRDENRGNEARKYFLLGRHGFEALSSDTSVKEINRYLDE
ncbi:MAG: Unknown protein [uncultured Sulfurovum sp.]|uniref:Uncharacterized protein n=1 Tax=uncultured Sulfurovum sp. TaxID=269237 RepID=A0A6S6U1G6_9BACT|nr:MAG: Unknown protein [uncultured Sulfurovum sp.]